MAPTYFRLAPEQGGTQFGPFDGGVVQIGSDPGQCQIVLNQQMNIAPVHVQVTDLGNGSYTVAPVQRGFGLFMAKAGQPNLHPIASAVQATSGDTLIIGNPNGPKFTLVRDETKPTSAAQGPGRSGKGKGLASAVGGEFMRQQKARLMMRNPLFQQANRYWYRWKSGSLTNPRTLVALAGGLFALLAGGVVSCGGILAGLSRTLN